MSVLEGKEELIEMHENPGYEGKNQKKKSYPCLLPIISFFLSQMTKQWLNLEFNNKISNYPMK